MTEVTGDASLKPQARRILRMAEQFVDMARLSNIDSQVNGNPLKHIFAQGAVLAFGIELMLKALHEQTLNKRAHGHDLWKLYKGLPVQVREALQAEYVDGAPEYDRNMDVLLASFEISPPQMEEMLKGSRDAFSLLRYAHEGKLPEVIGPGRLMNAIRRYLFKAYPDADWLS